MNRTHSQSGHTLIEVMIASTLMTIGALGTMPLFYSSASGTAVASKITQATALAESKLGALTHFPYEHLALTAGTVVEGTANIGPDGDAILGSAYGAQDGHFIRSWTITEKDVNTTLPGNDYKEIEVIVKWWDAPTGRFRSVSLAGGKAVLR